MTTRHTVVDLAGDEAAGAAYGRKAHGDEWIVRTILETFEPAELGIEIAAYEADDEQTDVFQNGDHFVITQNDRAGTFKLELIKAFDPANLEPGSSD